MITKKRDYLYILFRVLVGFTFFIHGSGKLLGWFGGNVVDYSLSNILFYAGIIETIGGALIILGLFVRPIAFITAMEMLVVLYRAHLPRGLNPLQNGGEPALLFFAAFLVLLAYGSGKLALGNLFRNKKL